MNWKEIVQISKNDILPHEEKSERNCPFFQTTNNTRKSIYANNMFMTCFHEFRIYESTNFFHEFFIVFFKRAIFQTFWKLHCCAKSLFFDLETSNYGYLLFLFLLTVQSFSKIGQFEKKNKDLAQQCSFQKVWKIALFKN